MASESLSPDRAFQCPLGYSGEAWTAVAYEPGASIHHARLFKAEREATPGCSEIMRHEGWLCPEDDVEMPCRDCPAILPRGLL